MIGLLKIEGSILPLMLPTSMSAPYMPRYQITITHLHDSQVKTKQGIKEAANLNYALLHYYDLAKKFYHENLIGFSCVEYHPVIQDRPKAKKREKGDGNWDQKVASRMREG